MSGAYDQQHFTVVEEDDGYYIVSVHTHMYKKVYKNLADAERTALVVNERMAELNGKG